MTKNDLLAIFDEIEWQSRTVHIGFGNVSDADVCPFGCEYNQRFLDRKRNADGKMVSIYSERKHYVDGCQYAGDLGKELAKYRESKSFS